MNGLRFLARVTGDVPVFSKQNVPDVPFSGLRIENARLKLKRLYPKIKP